MLDLPWFWYSVTMVVRVCRIMVSDSVKSRVCINMGVFTFSTEIVLELAAQLQFKQTNITMSPPIYALNFFSVNPLI